MSGGRCRDRSVASRHRHRRIDAGGEHGQATVELALLLPLVVVLLLVLLQVAFLGIDRIVVLGAAREAAREAAVTGDRGRIEAAARRLVTNGDAVDVDVTTDAAGGRRAYGAAVTATVRVTTRPRVPVASGVFPERITLQSSVTTRIEQQ